MPAPYISEKLIKFELPDGRIYQKETTTDYKFMLVYNLEKYPEYVIEGFFKTNKGAERRIEYLKKINWYDVNFVIVKRLSKEYTINL